MTLAKSAGSAGRFVVGGLAVAAAAYGGLAAYAWRRYGRPPGPDPAEADALLDRFMPRYDVVERQHIRVQAPADIVLAAACDQDIQGPAIARAVFKGGELFMGA